MKVHKTPELPRNVLGTFNLRPVSRGSEGNKDVLKDKTQKSTDYFGCNCLCLATTFSVNSKILDSNSSELYLSKTCLPL